MIRNNLSFFGKKVSQKFLRKNYPKATQLSQNEGYRQISYQDIPASEPIGIIAGNGPFPILLAKDALSQSHKVFAVCHENETDLELTKLTVKHTWIRVGQLGTLISFFKENNIKYVVMAGGISRIKHFGDIKLDTRGASLIFRLRSTKDDVVMRGIAAELESEGISVVPCTIFMKDSICPLGLLSKSKPTNDENSDIEVGIAAINAMSSQDIGQMVVVKEGVITAVEAVEGTNETIKRGAALGRSGTVVVKFAKPTQDMRFDVPTVGISTFELLRENKVRVLALEAGRSIILDKEECLKIANDSNLAVVGVAPLVSEVLS